MNKQALIILPGWGGNKDTWKEFAEIASNDFDVKIIELPCFGDEPCPNEVWGVEDYAEFAKSKISELRTPNSELILLGHSFGGQVASVIAIKNPELINKLILSAPAVFRPKKLIKRLIFGTGAKFGRLIFKLPFIEKFSLSAEHFFHKLSGSHDYGNTSGIKRDIFKNIIRCDLSNSLGKIKIPTLILWGTVDGYVPVSDAYKLNKFIQNSKLEIIKGGRHGLHLQMPGKLLEIIGTFVRL